MCASCKMDIHLRTLCCWIVFHSILEAFKMTILWHHFSILYLRCVCWKKNKTFSIKNNIVNTELSTWLFIGTLTAIDAENAHFNKTFWHRKLNLEWQRFSNQFTFATRLYLPTLNNFNRIWVSLENLINFVCNPALLTRFYDKLLKLKPTKTFFSDVYIAFQSISVPVHWLSIRRLKEIMFASFFAKVSKIFLYLYLRLFQGNWAKLWRNFCNFKARVVRISTVGACLNFMLDLHRLEIHLLWTLNH